MTGGPRDRSLPTDRRLHHRVRAVSWQGTYGPALPPNGPHSATMVRRRAHLTYLPSRCCLCCCGLFQVPMLLSHARCHLTHPCCVVVVRTTNVNEILRYLLQGRTFGDHIDPQKATGKPKL